MSSLMGKNVTFDRCTFVNILKSSLIKTNNIFVKINFALELFEFRWLADTTRHDTTQTNTLKSMLNTVSL